MTPLPPEKTTLKKPSLIRVNDRKEFIEWDDLYKNIDHYNPNRERKDLIVFDDMIAEIVTNKKFQAVVKELFIRRKKLNI